MHELSITKNIMEIVRDKALENRVTKVTQIKVCAGSLSGIEPQCVQFYFDLLRNDYGLSEAELVLHKVPALFKCRNCSYEFESDNMVWTCNKCNHTGIEIINGSECYIESIEAEV